MFSFLFSFLFFIKKADVSFGCTDGVEDLKVVEFSHIILWNTLPV